MYAIWSGLTLCLTCLIQSKCGGHESSWSPIANATGHPCKLPDGVVDGVLMSAWASIHKIPPSGCAFANAKIVAMPIEWSPPTVTGSVLFSCAAVAASKISRQQSLTILGLLQLPYTSLGSALRVARSNLASGSSTVAVQPSSAMSLSSPNSSILSGPLSTPPFPWPPLKGALITVTLRALTNLYSRSLILCLCDAHQCADPALYMLSLLLSPAVWRNTARL
ncbi:hypothetical protein OGATHE_003547 [Ogataea polymorpha]|uniref:Secreted protein n=1 Tax=Ogataea polymorpha TaxID=460523 RepID=A0A9P8P3T1_9ASCO|nr:hypothetical protein OGATHE_003547 [Ogataea polymorpha]